MQKEIYTKDEEKSLRMGFYVALAIVCVFLGYVFFNNQIEHAENGTYYPLKATFGRTDGLLVGDKVRMAGIDIGRITNAELDENFHAVLTLEISDSVKVPDDSSASIVSSGIMGAKYIEIEPGGSEDYMPANAVFSYTQDAMVLEELVDRIIGIGKSNRSSKENEKIEELKESINE